jgi:hypothetical protein
VLWILRSKVSHQVIGCEVSQYAVVDGYGVCTIPSVEFLHQIIDMEPDCLVAQVELEGDLLICVALGYVSEHLELSLC